MLLKIISLSALILSLVACSSSDRTPKTTTNESAKPAASAPAKKDARAGAPLNALDKAKGVQGVVDNTAKEADKNVDKNTQ